MKLLSRKATRSGMIIGILGMMMSIVHAAEVKSVRPINEITDISREDQTEELKKAFIDLLQKTLADQGISEGLKLYDTELQTKYAPVKDDFDILFLKAAICVSADRAKDADAICKKLIKIDPNNEDVIALSATIAKLLGNTKERQESIKKLLAKDALNPQANIELADDAFARKNYNLSKKHYKRALAREPENMDALRGLGKTEYYLENDEDAKSAFNKILDKDPKNVQAYLYLGKIAYANSEYKIASDFAKKAVEYEPGNYECFLDFGMYENGLGHYESAEKAWSRAIELQPNYFLPYAYRAGLYDEAEKFDNAIKDYEKVLNLNPKYYFAYESLGVLELHSKQWSKAREAFMKCYEFNKNNISYPLMITYCYYMEKNDIQAKEFSNKILRKMNRESMDYAMLRIFHDKAGEKSLFQKIAAIENRNKQGKMYFYLGLFYEMFGGKEFAKENYAKVIDMKSPMFFEYRLAEWKVKED